MRNVSVSELIGPADASRNGSKIDSNQLVNFTVQTIVTGGTTAAGTMKVQGSNDLPTDNSRSLFVPTNWSDLPNATATMTAGVAPLIVCSNVACQYIRVVFTRSAGPSSEFITVKVNGVGV